MPNTLLFSELNPIRFYKNVPDVNPQFNTRLFDDWFFPDTILDWEDKACFHQPWQTTDLIPLQFQCNYGPINLQLRRASDDVIIDTIPAQQIRQNYNDPSLFIYQLDVSLTIYDPGYYYFTMTFGSPIVLTLRSDIIDLKVNHPYSLWINYRHHRFYGDIIWETGFIAGIRIPGALKFKNKASVDTIYKDQRYNPTMIRSVTYRIWTLFIGISEGVPDFIQDIMMDILGCSDVKIDNKGYAKNEGAVMEEAAEEDWPMRGWTIELLPKFNRTQRIYENDQPQNILVAVMANSDSKGFGNSGGSNETVIRDVI